MVHLAIATGIPPSVWEAEDDRYIATAVDIFAERSERT